MTRVRVKVCSISSVEEARTAVEAAADAIGLVSMGRRVLQRCSDGGHLDQSMLEVFMLQLSERR